MVDPGTDFGFGVLVGAGTVVGLTESADDTVKPQHWNIFCRVDVQAEDIKLVDYH